MTDRKTPKQRVQHAFPLSYAVQQFGLYIIYPDTVAAASLSGLCSSEEEAWADAARRLK